MCFPCWHTYLISFFVSCACVSLTIIHTQIFFSSFMHVFHNIITLNKNPGKELSRRIFAVRFVFSCQLLINAPFSRCQLSTEFCCDIALLRYHLQMSQLLGTNIGCDIAHLKNLENISIYDTPPKRNS